MLVKQPNRCSLTPPNFHLKLRGFEGGAPEKILRFCKALSIIFIIENLAKKGGSKSCQMFAELNCIAPRKSNRFFIFYISLQILSSTSIFALLSPDCYFNLVKLVALVLILRAKLIFSKKAKILLFNVGLFQQVLLT